MKSIILAALLLLQNSALARASPEATTSIVKMGTYSINTKSGQIEFKELCNFNLPVIQIGSRKMVSFAKSCEISRGTSVEIARLSFTSYLQSTSTYPQGARRYETEIYLENPETALGSQYSKTLMISPDLKVAKLELSTYSRELADLTACLIAVRGDESRMEECNRKYGAIPEAVIQLN